MSDGNERWISIFTKNKVGKGNRFQTNKTQNRDPVMATVLCLPLRWLTVVSCLNICSHVAPDTGAVTVVMASLVLGCAAQHCCRVLADAGGHGLAGVRSRWACLRPSSMRREFPGSLNTFRSSLSSLPISCFLSSSFSRVCSWASGLADFTPTEAPLSRTSTTLIITPLQWFIGKICPGVLPGATSKLYY